MTVVVDQEKAPTILLGSTCRDLLLKCRSLGKVCVKISTGRQLGHLRPAGYNNGEENAATSYARAAGDRDGSESNTSFQTHARPKSPRSTAGKTSKRRDGIKKRLPVERQTSVPFISPGGLEWRLSASKLEGLDLTKLLFLQMGRNDHKISGCFNESLASFTLPPNLQVLKTGFHYDKPIQSVRWPRSLKEVWFGCKFNQGIDGVLWPPKLVKLVFDPAESLFNKATEIWPASLKQLTLGQKFNQPLRGLPLNLQRLRLGRNFDKPIDGVLWPESLKEIRFGVRFNQPITAAATWPASLKMLSFGTDFEQSLDKTRFPAHTEVTVRGISVPHETV